MAEKSSEKRNFERFEVSAPVLVEIPTPGQKAERMTLEGRNLSASGILLKTNRAIPPGTAVKLEISLHFFQPDASSPSKRTEVIIVSGQVIRMSDGEMAVRFNDDYDIRVSYEVEN